MLHLAITNRKKTHDGIWNFGQKQKHVQHSRLSLLHTVILPSVMFLHEFTSKYILVDENPQ